MDRQDTKPGTIITGPKWPEPVEVKKIDDVNDYIHIIGATTITGKHVDQLIPVEELPDLKLNTIQTDFKSERVREKSPYLSMGAA